MLSDDISYSLVLTGPPPPLPPLQPSGMDAPPNSATSSVPTVVTTGIHHQPPPAPPSLFTAGAVLVPSKFVMSSSALKLPSQLKIWEEISH